MPSSPRAKPLAASALIAAAFAAARASSHNGGASGGDGGPFTGPFTTGADDAGAFALVDVADGGLQRLYYSLSSDGNTLEVSLGTTECLSATDAGADAAGVPLPGTESTTVLKLFLSETVP